MKAIRHSFNGTGATVYLSLGFIPNVVRVFAAGNSAQPVLEWADNIGVAAITDGVIRFGGSTANTALTAGGGIAPYEGGDLLTSANQTSVANGEGVYLSVDRKNYAPANNLGLNAGDGSAASVTTWTLDTAENRTGHFDADVVGTYIGAGSRILIAQGEQLGSVKEYWATIEALTAGNGISADEVTLSRAIKSGFVRHISNKWSLAPTALGKVTTAGVVLYRTTNVNVNDERQIIEAYQFDE